ncbi:hypothetical protein [Variovorax sp. JS1663]|uniref:hypothetical protein n=1 Tax=Variovorax sp. JS1663 TaxID=1851577 RepID=UPI00117F0761|nr:hypothetical protein [Variovorax sp. JS1663]
MTTVFQESEGRIVMRTDKEIRPAEVQADMIQAWLDENDLVVQFKTREFKAPPPKSNPWKAKQ